MGETSKAKARREREGFFDLLVGKGIDVGCGSDPVKPDCVCWDRISGREATVLAGITDGSMGWVHSSHCLEHLPNPVAALKEWWRVVEPGGVLALLLPHRDLYEKREQPPSRWNKEHVWFFVPEGASQERALSVRQLLTDVLPDGEIVYIKECSEGWKDTGPDVHAVGEYSIEAVVRKAR